MLRRNCIAAILGGMSGTARGKHASDTAGYQLVVWHALVTYTGNMELADAVFSSVVADGRQPLELSPGPDHWRRLFDRGQQQPSAEVPQWTPADHQHSVELLAPADDRDSFGSKTAGLSRLLTSLALLPDPQRRAVVGKHVCNLGVSDVAALVELEDAEAAELLRRAESTLAVTATSDSSRGPLEPASVTTARRFTAVERLALPATAMPTSEPASTTPSFERSTVLAAVAVGSVAVIGFLLIAGNSGVDRLAEPETSSVTAESGATSTSTSTSAGTTSEAAATSILTDAQRAAEQAELRSALRSPDRSVEIFVTRLGEIVRVEPETREEIWRTGPLGDVVLSSVDLNTVTISQNGVTLRLSLLDGTFLPP